MCESLLKSASASVSGGLQRNGNDLRRSLRRINSMTRRKLSPIRGAGSPDETPSNNGRRGRRKHSHASNEVDLTQLGAASSLNLSASGQHLQP